MNRVFKNALLTSIILFILLGITAFIYSFINFPPDIVSDSFRTAWLLNDSLLLFIKYFMTVHLSAVLLTFSFSIRGSSAKTSSGSILTHISKLRGAVVFYLLLALLYAFLLEGLQPKLEKKQNRLQKVSAYSEIILEKADLYLAAGEVPRASHLLQNLLLLDPRNSEAFSRIEQIPIRPGGTEDNLSETSPNNIMQSASGGLTYLELVRKAQELFDNEDWYSAFYYATIALGIDDKKYEARRVASASWEKIASTAPGREKVREYDYFHLKREGFSKFSQEDFISAYYIFQELQAINPSDPDVKEYLPVIKEGVRTISFFIDDVEDALLLPGYENILFLNEDTDDETEIVYAGKLVETTRGIYLEDIDIVRYTRSAEVVYHVTARFGKMIDGHLNMHCIDRSGPGKSELPVYQSGSRPEELKYSIRIDLPENDLKTFTSPNSGFSDASLAELWSLKDIVKHRGYNDRDIRLRIILRLFFPFSFVLLTFYAIGAGWRLRNRYLKRPPILLVVILPLILGVVELFVSLFGYLYETAFSYLSHMLQLPLLLTVFVLFEFLLLILGFFYLAGQITE
jgi:tetratricopeptide (TPR) repeat protein